MGDFFRDLRIAWRMLAKAPGFAALAILTLALGIGANTAVFSVVDGFLLAPLPYRHSSRLVDVYTHTKVFNHSSVAYPNFLDWQRENRVFSAIAAYRYSSFNFTGNGAAKLLTARMVSANLFHLLGVPLALGRGFTRVEDRIGGPPAVILSYGLWQRRFSGRTDILGRAIELSGKSYIIVGIAPRHFRLGHRVDLYMPIAQGNPAMLTNRQISPGIHVLARLRPGVTLAAAAADMRAIALRLAHAYPQADRHYGVGVQPLRRWLVRGHIAQTLWLLLGAVALVLLIACANVANLTLARALKRNREFAVRAALGAGPARLARQLLTENLLLSLGGGALGVALAWLALHPLLAAVPGSLPHLGRAIAINLPVLGFTFALAVAAGLLFGLAPLVHGLRLDLQRELKEGGRGASASRHRAQSALIVAEIALTLVLLVGAGLLLRSLRALLSIQPGFETRHVLTFSLALPPAASHSPSAIRHGLRVAARAVAHAPGVRAAGMTTLIPLGGSDSDIGFWRHPGPPPPSSRMRSTMLYIVNAGYRRALRIPLLRGRFISRLDRSRSARVVVIDRVLAAQAFPGRTPVGKRLYLQFLGPATIVGEVGHVHHWGLAADATASVRPQIYLPIAQIPAQFMLSWANGMAFVARTHGPAQAALPAIHTAIRRVSADEPLYSIRSMRQIVAASEAHRRLPLFLLELFAGLAALLSAIGVYGVISYSVAQRTRELGIRQALGAGEYDLLRLVLGDSFRLALSGIAVGLLLAIPAALLLKRLLYGVSVFDPATLIAAALAYLAVALLAGYLPARAAASINPLDALHVE